MEKHLLKEDKTYEAEVAETTVTNHVRVVTARIEKRWRTLDVKHKDAENADQVFSERPENITDKSDIRESTEQIIWDITCHCSLYCREE